MINENNRTVVNLLGVPTILGSIYLGDYAFFIFIWIIAILGSLEYNRIVQIEDDLFPKVISIFFISILLFGYKLNYNLALVPFVVISIMIIQLFSVKNKPLYSIATMVFGVLWMGMLLGSLVVMRDIESVGFELIVIMFISVWSCDSFAFIFGKYFGQTKIWPSISPKKTWLGTIMGLMASILSVYIFYIYGEKFGFNFQKINAILNITDVFNLGIIFGGLGQLGDFFESLLKREVGIKDSGKILKGHGGILDRFDSILFVAPSLYIYIEFILKGRL
tara:strand:- start:314 stop:1144 length:831 start_codon:yes stop_codon:yes gene_type:complete